VENWTIEASPFGFSTESGDSIHTSIEPQYERLPEAFEISDGVAIVAGEYRWTRYSVEVETADKRPLVLRFEAGVGGFYNGTRRQMAVGITLKPSTHFAFGLESERNTITLPAGSFVTTLVGLKGDYNFSPNLSWANLVQYDSESRELGVQSRFRWILKPGNDVFLVINRGWYKDELNRYHRLFDKGTVKLQYTFRL
jgi:hypothetical protein